MIPNFQTPPLATTSVFSESVSLLLFLRFICVALDCTRKWYHVIFVFLCLTSLSMIISSASMLLQMVFFIFYGQVIFHCIYITSSLSIHLVSGPLGCFHVLAVVNSAVMNRQACIFWIIVLSGYKSRVQFSHSVVSDSLQPHESQHARPSCPSPTPRVHSNSCPSSQWCHPAISSSVVPFSSCP